MIHFASQQRNKKRKFKKKKQRIRHQKQSKQEIQNYYGPPKKCECYDTADEMDLILKKSHRRRRLIYHLALVVSVQKYLKLESFKTSLA